MKTPLNLIEISWEVCNLVGGIHTVLASKAQEMNEQYGDRYLTIGPDLPCSNQEFREEVWDPELKRALSAMSISCRMGRWTIPGEPRCLLIKFESLHQQIDSILADYWERYKLNSLYGGWDYLEPLMFGHAAGMVVELFYNHNTKPSSQRTVVQCHEWMTASAILYLRKTLPEVATVFTTHATVMARALWGNDRVFDFKTLNAAKLEELAMELGVSAKHSMETIAARISDCFTTVSGVTADECEAMLGRRPDCLLLNALGEQFPDPKLAEPATVAHSRTRLLELAQWTTGSKYDPDQTTLLVSAGRYEFKNKGIDVLLDSLHQLNDRLRGQGKKKLLAFLMLPAGTIGPRRTSHNDGSQFLTHELRDEQNDPVCRALRGMRLLNDPSDPVHVIFVPIYLDGNDSLIPEKYYELAAGADITAFPSLYEPWGYTPMESIAFGVPTITSDLAGFGHWALEQGSSMESGVTVLKRKDRSRPEAARDLLEAIVEYMHLTKAKQQGLRTAALKTSFKCRWANWGKAYFEAHRLAAAKSSERIHAEHGAPHPENLAEHQASLRLDPKTHMRNFVVLNELPKKIEELRELSRNISWCWDHETEELISSLDPVLWAKSGRNPTLFLDYVKSEFLESAAHSPAYLKKLERVWARFKKDQEEKVSPTIAYFCAEYGLSSYLKFYSGGLGVLAGDLLKTASDVKLPLCAVGLAYHQGYFEQHINKDGNQENHYAKTNFYSLPMQLVRRPDGHPLVVTIPFPSGPVHIRTWKLAVGTVDLYLLDTDFSSNKPEDRAITDRLYGGDRLHRLRQEFVLGIGGVKFLKAAGLSPQIFHMNEGHSGFLVIARLLSLMTEKNLSYDEALEYIRGTSIFTTHTPVAAGHDEFPEEIIRPYLSPYSEALHKDWASLFDLGKVPNSQDNKFSMTYLCLRGSMRVNGVSEIHGHVSREMFKDFYPGSFESEIPVRHITNGVHVHTWLASDWDSVFSRHVGTRWKNHLTDADYWEKLHDAEPATIWQTHLKAKSRLVSWLKGHIEESFRTRREDPSNMAQALLNLDQNPLIIGFARRFAPYKRANLLFRNLKKLESLLSKEGKPVVFVFAGKSHPSDTLGQELIKRVVEISRQPAFAGKILFVENYSLDVARLLVSGCDVWLNTPTRPLEASGTSGMKAGINGVLNLSVADGWWAESYNGKNGWIVAGDHESNPQDFQNEYDSVRIYALLEQEVIPAYFDRDQEGVPTKWVAMMKESMATIIPKFSSERMLSDYNKGFYEPALEAAETLGTDNFAGLRDHAEFKRRIRQSWESIVFADAAIEGLERHRVMIDRPVNISVDLHHPGLSGDDILVQAILRRSLIDQKSDQVEAFPAELIKNDPSRATSAWKAELTFSESGPYSLGVRVLPRRTAGAPESEMFDNLIKWL